MPRWFPFGVLILVAIVAAAQDREEKPGNSCGKILDIVADIPMPMPAVRFDYQSMDVEHGRLYIAHMNADHLVVFDTAKREIVANLEGFKRVHGVIAVPEIGRVFASATGDHQLATVDMKTLKTLGMAGPIDYPDGVAYAPKARRVFVSDEHGAVDAVIDVATNKLIKNIQLGGYAGNTVYDPGSGHILVAVHGLNQLVSIDPVAMNITNRFPLAGIKNPHGIALDVDGRLAFIAGEGNHSLAVFDLEDSKVVAIHQVGDDPDVLAYDGGIETLYVSAESGTVTVLKKNGKDLRELGRCAMPHAHTVSVDPGTHLVYFPLEDIDGKPILRIMRPVANN